MSSDTLRSIVGVLKKPDGNLLTNQTLTITRTHGKIVSQGDSVISPNEVKVTTDGNGAVSFSLVAGNYTMLVPILGQMVKVSVSVPDLEGPHELEDLLDTEDVPDSTFTNIQNLEASAVAAEAKAKQWASEANDVVVETEEGEDLYSAKHYASQALLVIGSFAAVEAERIAAQDAASAAATSAQDTADLLAGFDEGLYARNDENLSELADADVAKTNLGFTTLGKTLVALASQLAGRTALGLGEVATYTLATLRSAYTLAQAVWDTGTGTTEGMISPAKLQTKLDAAVASVTHHEDVVDLSGTTGLSLSEVIPDGVNEIRVSLSNLSLSGANDILIQVGNSGGFITSGYASASNDVTSSTGLVVDMDDSSDSAFGHMVLTRMPGTNVWISSHSTRQDGAGNVSNGGGYIDTVTALDRIRVITSGSNTFDSAGLGGPLAWVSWRQ